MKNICKLMILALTTVIISCDNDYLDETKPGDKISEADVWSSPALASKVVDGGYVSLPISHTYFMMMSAVDEGMFQYNDLGTPYTHSNVTPQNLGTFASSNWAVGQSDWNWTNVYKNIRNMTIALKNLPNVPFTNKEELDGAMADAYFIRAYAYFMLMANYGGVILYDTPTELGDEYDRPRSSFKETVDYILNDLENAISLYDASEIGTVKTRGDKGSAMAIKAKVLLYAASDLHNPSKNQEIVSGYSNPELIGYTEDNGLQRWRAARDAAKAVIDLNVYNLYEGNPDKQRNFEEVFLNRSSEDIFLRYTDRIIYDWHFGITPLALNSPGFGGWGTNAVLGDLVDSFEMSNGTTFSWDNPQHASDPYANRDPRLYASVLFEGADWYSRESTDDKMRMGIWPDGSTGPDHQYTNYWVRKWIDVNYGLPAEGDLTATPPWIRMRYAEVLLNYAEACIELGEDEEARTYINMIRSRAGMPSITDTGLVLKQRCRNERRVEFAFEEQRFFDVRRWMIGPESAQSGHGVKITYPVQNSFENPSFSKVLVDAGRTWDNKAYFLPIDVDEMNKNNALIQNPGY